MIYKEINISVTENNSATTETKRAWHLPSAENKWCSIILYLLRISFKIENKLKCFQSKRKHRNFLLKQFLTLEFEKTILTIKKLNADIETLKLNISIVSRIHYFQATIKNVWTLTTQMLFYNIYSINI